MSPQYKDGNDKLDSAARHKTKDNDGHDNSYVKITTPTSASDKTRHKTKDNDGLDNYPYVKIATPTSANSTARHKTNGHDVQVPTPTSAPDKRSRDKVFEVLNRCGKKVEDVTRIAGGIKDHLKFSPSIREAAMARLAQGTKMVVEGGPERVFQREFGILAAEKLVDSFACYISTTTGPVTGMLYISNKRIAFCSDYAIRLPSSAGGTGVPAYYKVVLEWGKISSISSSSNVLKPCERYVHVVTRNGSEFWFMGFVSYNDAFNCLNKASSVANVSCN